MLDGKQVKNGSIPNSKLQNPAAYPVTSNKGMTASVTDTDFDEACATAIASTPANDSFVSVEINGLEASVGDGVKTKDCYFSADSGTTAKAMAAIASGDKLYWVGSVAGYELAITDRVDFVYSA